MKESEFARCLESVLEPAIERNEQRYRDVDYDIVSGDGLVGTAASLQSLPPHKSATFLRVFLLTFRYIRVTTCSITYHYTEARCFFGSTCASYDVFLTGQG